MTVQFIRQYRAMKLHVGRSFSGAEKEQDTVGQSVWKSLKGNLNHFNHLWCVIRLSYFYHLRFLINARILLAVSHVVSNKISAESTTNRYSPSL